jgi:peptidoglycan/xylan/chitin deacetylase (PgdA/CDA1 family)
MPDGPFSEPTGSRLRRGTARALSLLAGTSATRPLLSLVQRWRSGQSFTVLTYHRIGGPDDPFFTGVSLARFEQQMRLLATSCNVLPVTEIVDRAEAGNLPPAAVGITFDDNYASVHRLAWPVMRQLGLSGMVFVPTGPLLGMGPLWYDRVVHAFKSGVVDRVDTLGIPGVDHAHLSTAARREKAADRALALLRTLGESERDRIVEAIESALRPAPWQAEPALEMGDLATLRRHQDEGLEIGSHSVTHPIFSGLDRMRVRAELRESRGQLEGWMQRPVELFAYPNGSPSDYGEETQEELAAAGYRCAFSTQIGLNGADWESRRYALLRNDATGTPARRLILRLAALSLAA